jgi:hypothetical protein
MPETCRVSYQNKIGIISASGWLFKKKSITVHGNMNVKYSTESHSVVYIVSTVCYGLLFGREVRTECHLIFYTVFYFHNIPKLLIHTKKL